ncbi:eukaryotic translation initiation factor 2 alpha subunit-domain-containing protein, partial [Phellopilus nigrolimitatus]
LEYNNIEGMILLSELSRRRIRSIQKLIHVGRNEVVVVMRVDKEKGYIDLSKRRVSPEDITKCEERFMKPKTVASILQHVASKLSSEELAADAAAKAEAGTVTSAEEEEEAAAQAGGSEEARLESLYDQIVWPLGKQYGHPYDAFKLALTESEKVFASLTPAPSGATLAQLTATIARRLTPQPIKLRADVELTCYTEAGIDAIKRALRAGEAASTEAVPIKAKLVAPPLYVLGTNATDKYLAVERLERAIETIQSTIEGAGGNLVVRMKPKTMSETEEQDLAQLMAKANAKNQEMSGAKKKLRSKKAFLTFAVFAKNKIYIVLQCISINQCTRAKIRERNIITKKKRKERKTRYGEVRSSAACVKFASELRQYKNE